MLPSNTEQSVPSVLIVDDDPTVIQTIVDFLHSDFTLSIAKTCLRAMQLLEQQHFDLVLLDVNLPDGNGIEVCRNIRGQQEYSELLPIIFITAEHSAEKEAKGLNVGANDYIYKPINRDVLKARVNLQIKMLRRNQLLANLVQIDGLTELRNRRAFDEQIEQEWQRAKREQKYMSLAMVDIDCFKQFNDTYGHPEGDKCLKIVGDCLESVCKRSSDFCFRYGGEEFAVIFYDTDAAQASGLMESALERLRDKKIAHKGSTVSDIVTFSCGVTAKIPENDAVTEIVNAADELLYEAKAQGRNRVVFHLEPVEPVIEIKN